MDAAGRAVGSATPENRSHASSIDSGDTESTPAVSKIDVTTLELEQFKKAFPGKQGVEAAYKNFRILIKFVQDNVTPDSFPSKGQAKLAEMRAGITEIHGAYKKLEAFCEAPVTVVITRATRDQLHAQFDPAILEAIDAYLEDSFKVSYQRLIAQAGAYLKALP